MSPPRGRPQVELLDDVFAAGLVRDFSVAVDGGANVGDWTAKMRERFDSVFAVEASPECAKMLRKRFCEDESVGVIHAALLDRAGMVRVVSPNKKPACQKRYVELVPDGDVRSITLDSIPLACGPAWGGLCGLIKLDLEGAEYPALLGAQNTIADHRPVLIVEFYKDLCARFGHTEDSVLSLIDAMGYKMVMESFPDRVFVHGSFT